jgi:hypothetical protein
MRGAASKNSRAWLLFHRTYPHLSLRGILSPQGRGVIMPRVYLTATSISPIFSIQQCITLPAFTSFTPCGVPVMMMSPGNSR